MVRHTSRAFSGSLSGGRSTMAENSQRSRGSVGAGMRAPVRSFAMIGPMRALIRNREARVADHPMALRLAIGIFALAFLVPAYPWLSGTVTIPWDAKSQFFPPLQFLATSIACGEWPWWTPNLFAGWPLIADPQSLLFSPLHVLLAASSPAVDLRAFDAVTFLYLFLGGFGVLMFFHDRGWHPAGGIVAAMAFALGGSASARIQHTIEIVSLAYLPLALWL